jgi:uncharacterized membrane protein
MRRTVQAVLYETIAIVLVTPVIAWIFSHPPLSAFALSATMSAVAMAWNYLFNAAYERWEAKQRIKGRTFTRRVAFGVAYEGGLTLFLIPIMAVWLSITVVEAFIANIGILAFFFVYTIAFTWAFDRVFGLPQSALLERKI